MKSKCLICNSANLSLIWNNKIRSSAKHFTRTREKILKCNNCELIFLKNRKKNLENSAYARSIYNKNNSIEEFNRFTNSRIKKNKFF